MTSIKKVLIAKGYIAHNIRIAPKSGHIITKAVINGYAGRFIIDTGASASCVNQDLQEAFQLETHFMGTEIGTASGSLIPRIAHNNLLQLGDWAHDDMTLLSMDMGFINRALAVERMRAIQGLLGADFLIAAKAIIDYNRKVMYLKPQKNLVCEAF
jgi:predicted aspartyl protease